MARDGAVLRQLAMAGEPPPDWSIPPPTTFPLWAQLARACFWDVHTERSVGFGSVCPVPWSKIREWGTSRGLRSRDLLTLEHVVRQMDNAYLDHLRAEQRREEARREAAHA